MKTQNKKLILEGKTITQINIKSYIDTFDSSPFAQRHLNPWDFTNNAAQLIRDLLFTLSSDEFKISDEIAIHKTATIEIGAILKGPAIIGPRCFIAAGAYLRNGNWLDADCIIGPSVEIKSSFIFSGTKLAHFNFVGDSILGHDVNLEAGSIIANYRNERSNKEIRVMMSNQLICTGAEKFGALIGNHCRIGANAVVAPGSLISPKTVLGRLGLLDQDPT